VPARKALKLLQRAYAGDNLFTVTAADVRATLKPLSFVRSASVDRDFPDTLAVHIEEYVPAAYALAGDRWYVVDEGGYVICSASPATDRRGGGSKPGGTDAASPSPGATATSTTQASPTPGDAATAAALGTDESATATATGGLATTTTDATGESGGLTARLVAGPTGASLPLPRIAVPGRAREGGTLSDGATRAMLGVITALPGSYRRRLAAVEDEGGQLTLRFAGGPVATWGDDARTLAKTVALRTVLAEYQKAGETCTQIDVSIPDRTLAKPVLK